MNRLGVVACFAFKFFYLSFEGHWFSLIESGKPYWVKVREIKKPI